MTEYGKTLRSLIDLSGVKMSTVAREVGYDLSYVSKWCNTDKLPATKTAPEINHAVGKLCSKEILKLDGIEAFNEGLHQSSNRDTLQKDIINMLNAAYDESKQAASKKHSRHLSSGETIVRSSEIRDFFSRRLPEILAETGEPLEVLCTLDVCKFLKGNLDSPAYENFNSEIKVRMGLDMERFLQDPNHYLKQLYYFINSKGNISFDFFDDSRMKNLNTLVVKDYLAVLCAVDQQDHFVALSVISEPEEVNQIYEKVLPAFRPTNLLMHSAESDQMFRHGYRTTFYSQSEFQIFQPYGFEFLLPEECWPSIAESAKSMDEQRDMLKITNQLHITWQETFEKARIDFFVLKSSLMKYMEDGEIIFADVVYTMTPEQRKLHIQNAMEMARKNKDITLYVIDDDMIPGVQHLLRMAIYNNGKTMFLKCPQRYHSETGPRFYTVLSDTLTETASRVFDEIKESPYCYKFDIKGMEDFMDKYGSMVNRIIELG